MNKASKTLLSCVAVGGLLLTVAIVLAAMVWVFVYDARRPPDKAPHPAGPAPAPAPAPIEKKKPQISFPEILSELAPDGGTQEILFRYHAYRRNEESLGDYPYVAEILRICQPENKDEQHAKLLRTLLKSMVRAGADVNAPLADGRTPLQLAGSGRMLGFLLSLGAATDPHATDEEWRTPLHSCTETVLAEHLKANGAKLDAADYYGCHPLETCPSDTVALYLYSMGATCSGREGSLLFCRNNIAPLLHSIQKGAEALQQSKEDCEAAFAEVQREPLQQLPVSEPEFFGFPMRDLARIRIPLRIDVVLDTVSAETVDPEEKKLSFCASGHIFTGTATITYQDGGTRCIPVQSGGWMSYFSIFVSKGICPLIRQAAAWDYDPHDYPDTTIPPMAGRSTISTQRRTSSQTDGFPISPDRADVADRDALMLHLRERRGSEGCLSSGTEDWEVFCTEMDHAKRAGVKSIPFTVRYEGVEFDPLRFPEGAGRSDVRYGGGRGYRPARRRRR